VALNCLMLIKGWRMKKNEINAQHHMFKARPFACYHFGPLLVFAGQSL
jgi:hypothetical protein